MSMEPENEVASRPEMKILRLVLPLAVLGAAVAAAVFFLQTPPEAKPRPATRNAALVEVRPIEVGPQTTMIHAMGTVQPDRLVELRPRVGGEVVELGGDFVPGGHLAKGERLLRIDPTDYRLTVRQIAGEVARVESELQLEQGNQLIARKEYELLGEPVSEEELALMLRRPQLENLQAALEAARARLEQARVNLARTEIAAPFNAVVQARGANLGARVGESTPLGTLIGTDEYWVEVSVPVSQLRWISIPHGGGPEGGSPVRLYDEAAWGPGVYRIGRVIRLAAALEESGRMARLLVRVEDPLSLRKENAGAPRLLIGSYVRGIIEGKTVPAAAAIEREFLRDGDRVWVLDAENRLDIRPVEIAYRGPDRVLVTGGLAAGERLIVSDLPAPVAAMPLRLRPATETAGDRPEGKPGS